MTMLLDLLKKKLNLLSKAITLEHEEVKLSKFERAINEYPMIAVDGSYLPLYSKDFATVYIFKVSTVQVKNASIVYNSSESIHVISQDVVIDDDPLVSSVFKLSSNERHQVENLLEFKEREQVLKMAKTETSHSIFLIDGSLHYQKKQEGLIDIVKGMHSLREKHSFVAISKTSGISTFKPPFSDEYYLQKFARGPGFRKVEMDWTLGEIYFSRFHEGGPFFRTDIMSILDPAKLLHVISTNCFHLLMPGYPILLIEAHRHAKLVRDMKMMYERDLLKVLIDADGQFSNERGEKSTFHDLLDHVTKVKRDA